MEIFAAILTAIFFWGFIYFLGTEAMRRRRRLAGPLLLRLKHSRKWRTWWQGWAVGAFLVGTSLAILIFSLSVADASHSIVGLMYFNAFMMLLNSVTIIRSNQASLEFRQYGLLYGGFTAWQDIKYVRWTGPGKLRVQWKTALGELQTDPSQMAEATAVLVKYVEVRDATGEIPVELLQRPSRTEAPEPPRVDPGRFQFSLTALLLLMLLASSAFSWYGIRYRRQQRVEQALAQFQRFRPSVKRQGSVVTELDFSQSTVKPGDVDLAELEHLETLWSLKLDSAPITDAGLVHLQRMRKLSWLDVSNTDVTDAGLVHLENLPKLRYLYLTGTQVTEEGVERLKEKLPDVVVMR